MTDTIKIGSHTIGHGHPCYVIAEAGINHNGDLATALKLIDVAASAGCQAVKFQKRTVDALYTAEQMAAPRESPFGKTFGEYKRGIEFGRREYEAIDKHCRERGIAWTASAWDTEAAGFVESFEVPFHKVASASITDVRLLEKIASFCKPVVMSVGMSTSEQVERAVDVFDDVDWYAGGGALALLHCVSTYPAKPSELNLACMATLRERYGVPVGYSGHEVGLAPTLAAVAMGACIVERHITLDRAMWGTDQAASLEPHALARLVRDIRVIESARGDGVKRVLDSELPVIARLRGAA